MDNDTETYITAIRKISEALLFGLETAVKTMRGWDDYTPEDREAIIQSIEKLVEQGQIMRSAGS